jgi:excisionase family DNA binding protein
VGNLNDYVKFQMAQGIGEGKSPVGGMASELAVGMAMAQQLSQQPGGILGQNAPAAAANPAGFDLLSPPDAAKLLGVTEADVLASIEAGQLKAKKIGSAYRISRAALEEFIKS